MSGVARLRGVTATYGAFKAFDGLDLDIASRATAIVGPNGAGKTTLFRVLLGLHRPIAGSVQLLGADVLADPIAARRRIGFVPDGDATVPAASGVRMVAHLAEVSGLPPQQALVAAHDALERVGLGEVRYRAVDTYSEGLRARLRIAQALAHGPELLILDEPTAGLDPDARRHVLDLLLALRAERGLRFLLASQNLDDVEEVCEEVLFMNGGALLARRSVADIRGGEKGVLAVRVAGTRAAELCEALRAGGATDARLLGNRRLEVRGVGPADVFRAARASSVPVLELGPRAHSVEEILVDLVRRGAPAPVPPAVAAVDETCALPPRGRSGRPWLAILTFEVGLALRRKTTLVCLALAFLAALLQMGLFFAQTQGSLGDEKVLAAQGPRLFTKATLGLLASQTLLAMIVLAFVAAGVVAKDLGARAGDLYFSRPIGTAGYLAGKGAVALFFLIVVLWVPLVAFLAYACFLGGQPGSPNWQLVSPDITLARGAQLVGALVIVSSTMVPLMLAVSARASSPRRASVAFAAIFVGGAVLGDALARMPGLAALRALSYPHILEDLERGLFGMPVRGNLPLSCIEAAALVAASLVLAARRVRRVERG